MYAYLCVCVCVWLLVDVVVFVFVWGEGGGRNVLSPRQISENSLILIIATVMVRNTMLGYIQMLK